MTAFRREGVRRFVYCNTMGVRSEVRGRVDESKRYLAPIASDGRSHGH